MRSNGILPAAVLAVVCPFLAPGGATAAEGKPNVVLILADEN